MDDSTLGTVDAPYYEWRRRVEPWSDYAVTFEIRPEFGSTAGSTWAALATAALTGFSAGYTGTPQPLLLPHQTFEFKAEFQDFRVYRDGQSLLPLHPGRQITERAFQNYDMTFIDEAYSGMYTYALDDFMTGETFRFEVFAAREPERVHKVLNLDGRSELIRQIRADFTEPIGTYEEAEVVASWLVLHDHSGGSFERSCSGRVVLTDSKLIFQSTSPWENWEAPLSAAGIDVGKNVMIGAHANAFHVRIDRRQTYNFSLVENEEQGSGPTAAVEVVRSSIRAARQDP